MWISSRLDNLLHGARQPTALGARKSGHADAPIRGDVDVVLGARSVRIRGGVQRATISFPLTGAHAMPTPVRVEQ
eukprot:scaffold8243_cov129-Isochrysis_galbana.AAC.5